MANDERQSETFIREVDEELRRDQLKAVWMRYAPVIIGACVLVVVLTAGYRFYTWWEERSASQAGDRYLAALELMEAGKRDEGEAALSSIVADGGPGYAALAQLRLAGDKAAAGEKPEALAAYDAVSADTRATPEMRDFARVRAALLALDAGDLDGATERATPLNASGNVWRHIAREVLGTAAYQKGDLAGAREIFMQIQQDAETTPDVWVRSGLMVALIDGQVPAQGDPAAGAAPDAASGAAAPEAAAPAPAELAVPEGGAVDALEPLQPAADIPAVAPAAVAAPSPVPSAAPTVMPEPSLAPAVPSPGISPAPAEGTAP